MKILNIILRVFLVLLLITPVLGSLGIFPPPTPDLYNTPQAFAFIDMLITTGYITYMMTAIFAVSIILIFMNRMALVALLLLPITINIVTFHAFLDGGIFKGGAVMGNMLFLINLYFLWANRELYRGLFNKSGN